jgi:hypothetical protein
MASLYWTTVRCRRVFKVDEQRASEAFKLKALTNVLGQRCQRRFKAMMP